VKRTVCSSAETIASPSGDRSLQDGSGQKSRLKCGTTLRLVGGTGRIGCQLYGKHEPGNLGRSIEWLGFRLVQSQEMLPHRFWGKIVPSVYLLARKLRILVGDWLCNPVQSGEGVSVEH
jgi:hypothetical protein